MGKLIEFNRKWRGIPIGSVGVLSVPVIYIMISDGSITMEKLVEWNNKLIGAPIGFLIFLACIGMGYVIKASHRVSNDWLPLALTLEGITLFMLGGPTWEHEIPLRIWLVRNFCFGLAIGIAAWASHKTVLNGHSNRHEVILATRDTMRKVMRIESVMKQFLKDVPPSMQASVEEAHKSASAAFELAQKDPKTT